MAEVVVRSLCGGGRDNAINLGTRELFYRKQRDHFSAKFEIAFVCTVAMLFGDFLILHQDQESVRLCSVFAWCRWAKRKAYIIEGSLANLGAGSKKGASNHASQPQHRHGGGSVKMQTHNQGNARTQDGRGKKNLYEKAWRPKTKLCP